MPDHSRTIELTIAGLALVTTLVLGIGQFRIADQQREAENKRAVDNIEVQVMSLVAPHLSNLAKPGPDLDASRRIAAAASEYLQPFDRTGLAKMARKISDGNSALSPDIQVRIAEATAPPVAGSRWFVVLASLPGGDEASARKALDQKLAQLKAAGRSHSAQLYKTKISKSFAIVLDGVTDRQSAVDLAEEVRRSNIAKDAFAQQDRGLDLVFDPKTVK